MAQRLKTDWILFTTVVLMVFFGAVMIYSASSVMAQLKLGSSWHFSYRQLAWMAVAIGVMMLLKRSHYRKLHTPAVAFAAMGFVMILLLMVYFADREQHRWIRFGPLGIQPSEFAKPALALFLAFFIALRSRAINSRYTLLPAALAVGLVTAGGGGSGPRHGDRAGWHGGGGVFRRGPGMAVFRDRAVAGGMGVIVFGGRQTLPAGARRAVTSIPTSGSSIGSIPAGGSRRTSVTRSRRAIPIIRRSRRKSRSARAARLGVGLMQGRQKLFYLPEAHTDMIYAVVGEEFGLFGSLALLLGVPV